MIEKLHEDNTTRRMLKENEDAFVDYMADNYGAHVTFFWNDDKVYYIDGWGEHLLTVDDFIKQFLDEKEFYKWVRENKSKRELDMQKIKTMRLTEFEDILIDSGMSADEFSEEFGEMVRTIPEDMAVISVKKRRIKCR